MNQAPSGPGFVNNRTSQGTKSTHSNSNVGSGANHASINASPQSKGIMQGRNARGMSADAGGSSSFFGKRGG